jgi:uncharacterized membrane protein
MPTTHLSTHADLPRWAVIAACVLAAVSFLLLLVEMRRRERARDLGGLLVLTTGTLALAALLLSIVRPVRVTATESVVGARVVVLADVSRSMALPDGNATRAAARDRALEALARKKEVRATVLGFGDGPPRALTKGEPLDARSDLTAALRAIEGAPEERPEAVVVVSDGRLDDPPEGSAKDIASILKVPIDTVATTAVAPADASIRRVTAAGAAVAHVPLPLRIEVGCSGGLACDELTVTARELHHDGPPTLLASGLAHLKGEKDATAIVELSVTLERAGVRVVEVALSGASGDTIPDNDRRLVTFNVAREKVRVLHVAGRPTDDVRTLRQWLKGDASIDLVAFFILRTPTDNVNVRSQDELALIPFPVDELFSEHLPSFDAVILQDFDAQPYGLEQHLPALASYVRTGGGLVMVGGPNSFVAGGYAATPLADVLPVHLDATQGSSAADPAPFVPDWTSLGKDAPLLGPLRNVLGDELPEMPGANVLEDARPGALVLWSHPHRRTKTGAPMPVLAVADVGNGRSIALGVDGGWRFDFSDLGLRTGGRAHGALWDGLLGWLMRDPRFEPAQLEMARCVAKIESKIIVRATGRDRADLALDIVRTDGKTEGSATRLEHKNADLSAPVPFVVPPLVAGGYSALLHVGDGATTRRDFACETGGDEWADSRPDVDRLRAIAEATGGSFHVAEDAASIGLPKATVVSTERHVAPIAPPWVWALFAAAAVGAHWYARRRSGLS